MASRGVNKAILIGNLGADPETRFTAGGTAVTNCNIATSEEWRDKQSGEMQTRTEWHRIVFFARLAEVAGDYLKKGAKVYVEGRIQTRKWQGQDGQDRYTTEIIASEMQMLDTRGGSGGGQAKAESQAQNAGHGGASASDYSKASRGGSTAGSSGAPPAGGDDDLDDDIPFGPVPWWAI